MVASYLMSQRFDLLHIPGDSELWQSLKNAGASIQLSAPCPQIHLDEDIVTQIARKQSVRRHHAKLKKIGPVSLELLDEAARSAFLEEFIEQHLSRWMLAGDSSLFQKEHNRTFYKQLVTHPHFDEIGEFHRLGIGEEQSITAGFHLGLKARNSFIWYKPSFNLNLENAGPGEVLLLSLIEYSLKKGYSVFDFTRGDEAFKHRFANHVERNRRAYRKQAQIPRIKTAIQVRFEPIRKKLGEVKRRFQKQRPQSEHFYKIDSHAPPTFPAELTMSFGEIDLVKFGSHGKTIAPYLNPGRMRAAVKRKKRGDKVLTLSDSKGVPVHFSWLRVDHECIQGDTGAVPIDKAVAVIFDCWTRPDYRGKKLYPSAISFLANDAAETKLEAWIYCFTDNTSSQRGIEKAGGVLQVTTGAS